MSPKSSTLCCPESENSVVFSDSYNFPVRPYESIGSFCKDYADLWRTAMDSLDLFQMTQATDCLTDAIRNRNTIFVCGNGGSAAVANHLHCDFLKGVQTGTDLLPKVVSLPANFELLLAIANDGTYDDVFVYPLRSMASKGDVLLTISSSGNSENIVRALQWAKANGLRTIAMTGFEGGRSRVLADISLHVDAGNYGIVENCHDTLAHMLAQYIRLSHTKLEHIPSTKF